MEDKKVETLILGILTTIFLSFLITLLVFSYQFMWFSVETIPRDRIVFAAVGTLSSGALTFLALMVYCEEEDEGKKKLTKKV